MIGDNILLNENHQKKADFILQKLHSNDYTERVIITIGGESGSGKTDVAVILREYLYEMKRTSYIISQDDYYFVKPRYRNHFRETYGIKNTVGYEEVNYKRIDEICKEYKEEDRILKLQEYNKFIDNMELKYVRNNFDFLIIEGLYSCYLESVDYRIYLEGTNKDTKNFRKERGKEKQTSLREKILNKEREDVLKTKNNANLIIPWRLK